MVTPRKKDIADQGLEKGRGIGYPLSFSNKQKSRAWSVTSGLQLPGVRGSMHGFKSKMLFSNDLVKWVNERRSKKGLSVRNQHRRECLAWGPSPEWRRQ